MRFHTGVGMRGQDVPPRMTPYSRTVSKWPAGPWTPTCMLAKEDCGARRILSEFCCAALSAARSLPGARLSATGLSEALESESESRQSELREKG